MQNMESVGLGEIRTQLRTGLSRLRANWGWFVAAGVSIILLGAYALNQSAMTTVVTIAFLGWMLAIGGTVAVAQSFAFIHEGFGNFLAHLLAGALYLVAGVLMIASPGLTAVTITLLIAPLFIVGGIFRIIASVMMRPPQWGWLTISGVLTTFVGAAIMAQWPVSGLWLIGAYVGVEMIFYGWSITTLGLAIKQLPVMERPALGQLKQVVNR